MSITYVRNTIVLTKILTYILIFFFLTILFIQVEVSGSISTKPLLKIYGVGYGPFRNGQNPDWGPFPSEEEIQEDMLFLNRLTNNIRTYGSTGGLESIATIASNYGINVIQGAWLSDNYTTNNLEIANAIRIANEGIVDSVIMGNEVLLRRDLSEAELISFINSTKNNVSIPVTTAEIWSIWENSPKLVTAVDFILVHIHPYWEGISVDNATKYVIDKYNELQIMYPDKKIVIGETGWPSTGKTLGKAVPGPDNQRKFIEEFVSLANQNSIEYYYFEVFDEEWKLIKTEDTSSSSKSESNISLNGVEQNWGLYHSDGTLKQSLIGILPVQMGYTTRSVKNIFVDGSLSSGFDIGVDSSGNLHHWLYKNDGYMKMVYPSFQSWGTVFITVGKPVQPPRPYIDLSNYSTLCVDLKGKEGGESVAIGIKDNMDPDDGRETKIVVTNLSTSWETYIFQLSRFYTADLAKIYVVIEFVFEGSQGQTVYFNNITFRKVPSNISCFVSPFSIDQGSYLLLSGLVSPVGNIDVSLEFTTPNEDTLIGVVQTDEQGSFSDTFVPDISGRWKIKAYFGGDSKHSGSDTSAVFFNVKRVISRGNGSTDIMMRIIGIIVITVTIIVIFALFYSKRKKSS